MVTLCPDPSLPSPDTMHIRVDPLTGPEVAALLSEHLQDMQRHSPPQSIHALDLERLRDSSITFWSGWDGNGALMGCAALRELSPYLRRGVASTLLAHVLEQAARRGYRHVSLETGSMAAFVPARALYTRFGFHYCGPFGDYGYDPNSVFMTRLL
jgi:putative acetyltransferase